MKKLLLVLAVIMLTAVLFVGCLPEWLTPTPEPEEPAPQVVVNAILENGEVDWSIENISEDHIYNYSLTFTVLYADVVVEKTQWEEVVTGTNLYPGDIDYGTLVLPVVVDMTPETLITVLATY